MSKIMSLLSGKGGSGKTTLALSISTMLGKCGSKVLLVDCDLSTNGATYFYEEKLINCNSSFHTLLYKNKAESFINIDKNIDFLPSITRINDENTNSYIFNEKDQTNIFNFCEKVKKFYDIIIFDCQAGYTDILKIILPCVDINLFVMEADAISSSALRSLYLKIGDEIKGQNAFQVFNKASDEEYKTYSKISGGTVFTNIETIVFDWKIRKAFSVAQVPDMENTSISYGKQIFNICKILFKEESIQKKLKKFELVLKLYENSSTQKEIEDKLKSITEKKHSNQKKLSRNIVFAMLPIMLLTICLMFYELISKDLFFSELIDSESTYFLMMIIICVPMIIVTIFTMLDITKERRENLKEINRYNKLLSNVEKTYEVLIKEKNDLKTEE